MKSDYYSLIIGMDLYFSSYIKRFISYLQPFHFERVCIIIANPWRTGQRSVESRDSCVLFSSSAAAHSSPRVKAIHKLCRNTSIPIVPLESGLCFR